jgi:ABC-type nitrate/sulfonate/bicarbonate transport system permease component
MFHKRFSQFLILYALGLSSLLLAKYVLHLSDYLIPGLPDLWRTATEVLGRYFFDALDTLFVAIIGHLLAIVLATIVGILGRLTNWIGTMIKTGAYNLQAYPIVAVAPIIFIFLGSGLSSRLLIAVLICYFPLLLSFISIFKEPVADIEHFYMVTGRMRWQLEVKIRAFENISKLVTVITGSATLAMVGTIVAEFIGADAGIGYSLRIALYQSDLAKVLIALLEIGVCNSLYLGFLEWIGAGLQRKMEVSL